jgi:hypothetical protein
MIKVLMPSIISLGKGEVESSILSCSTSKSFELSTVFSLNRVRAASVWTKSSPGAFPAAVVKLRAIAKFH